MNNLQQELRLGIKALELASERVLRIYDTITINDARFKSDKSPVSIADTISNQVITEILENAFEYPILSEENEDDLSRLLAKKIWILDPLDGTREFLAKRNEFTINLALVQEGKVLLGIVAVPVHQQIYYACKDQGAFLKKGSSNIRIEARKKKTLANLDIAVSRSHLNPGTKSLLEKMENCNTLSLGSALKYCLVASGGIDATIRKTPLYEWDLAASDCIVAEAGGTITNLRGEPFIYNQRKTLLEDGVIAANHFLHQLLLNDIIGA